MESCVKFPYMKCSNFTHHFIYEIFIYEMLCEISVRAMLYDDSDVSDVDQSSSESDGNDTDSSLGRSDSSADDDLEVLLLESLYHSNRVLGHHLSLEDIDETDCIQWFR